MPTAVEYIVAHRKLSDTIEPCGDWGLMTRLDSEELAILQVFSLMRKHQFCEISIVRRMPNHSVWLVRSFRCLGNLSIPFIPPDGTDKYTELSRLLDNYFLHDMGKPSL